MKAIEIVCSTVEWWGSHWQHAKPYALDVRAVSDIGVMNAPVSIYVLTPNSAEAAHLLRLAADSLEREPEVLEREPAPYVLVYDDDGQEVPF